MRQRRYALPVAALGFAFVFSAPGCHKKPTPVETVPSAAAEKPVEARPTEPSVEVKQPGFDQEKPETAAQADLSATELARRLKTVYFELDSAELGPSGVEALKFNADILRKYPDVPMVVEGHCDERGTIEYNLALGQRRADVVREYLSNLGVDSSRLRVISYGEERPADPGHGETSWAKNRRGEFVP